MKVFDVESHGWRRISGQLWFYLTYREWGADNTVPGMFINRNAGNPNAGRWISTRLAKHCRRQNRNGIARITWQATPRNKINLHWSEQYNTANSKGRLGDVAVEASGRQLYQPPHIQRRLVVASRAGCCWRPVGNYISHFMNPQPRPMAPTTTG